ncbi:APC family permease [Clostridia bacterium]|nr:APC family permease [Clostridia bacterium]
MSVNNKETNGTTPSEVKLSRYDQSSKLKRGLRLLYVYALATGAIYTFIGYWDGMFMSAGGPATFLSFILMTLMCLPIAFIYSELATMMPNCGGELVYNTIGLSKHFGFLSAWLIMAAWLIVPPAGVLGIIEWFSFSFQLDLSLTQMFLIAAIALAFYCTLSMLNIQIAGKVQSFMLFSSLTIVAITTVLFLFSKDMSLSNFNNFIASGYAAPGTTLTPDGLPVGGGSNWYGWLIGTALIITPFFGFEIVPQMVEEGTFPIKSMSKAIIGSVVTCGLIYSLFYFALQSVKPWAALTNSGDFSPFISLKVVQETLYWLPGWFWIFGVAAVLFTIGTSVLGFWISGVRLLYAMGRQGFLPKSFSKTNKYDQPIIPNLLILGLALVQLAFSDSAFLANFYSLMAFSVAVAYFITTISSIRLAIREPDWERPFKLKGGMAFRVFTLIICLAIMIGTAFGQPAGAWRALGIYMLVGLALYMYMMIFRWKKEPVWMICPSKISGEFEEKEF